MQKIDKTNEKDRCIINFKEVCLFEKIRCGGSYDEKIFRSRCFIVDFVFLLRLAEAMSRNGNISSFLFDWKNRKRKSESKFLTRLN